MAGIYGQLSPHARGFGFRYLEPDKAIKSANVSSDDLSKIASSHVDVHA